MRPDRVLVLSLPPRTGSLLLELRQLASHALERPRQRHGHAVVARRRAVPSPPQPSARLDPDPLARPTLVPPARPLSSIRQPDPARRRGPGRPPRARPRGRRRGRPRSRAHLVPRQAGTPGSPGLARLPRAPSRGRHRPRHRPPAHDRPARRRRRREWGRRRQEARHARHDAPPAAGQGHAQPELPRHGLERRRRERGAAVQPDWCRRCVSLSLSHSPSLVQRYYSS